MRLLKFNVDAQTITEDPMCDFNNIVANTRGYLIASFAFSHEWDGCKKVVSFWRGSKEYAFLLDESCNCYIPAEVLTNHTFRISIIGLKQNYRITTNKIVVRQGVS